MWTLLFVVITLNWARFARGGLLQRSKGEPFRLENSVINRNTSDINENCFPSECTSTWHYFDQPVTYQCNVASGALPLDGLKLPMIFEGNYNLCKTFEEAHFCRIKVPLMFLPADDVLELKEPDQFVLSKSDIVPIGTFLYDICLNEDCQSEDLRYLILDPIKQLVHEAIGVLSPNKDKIKSYETKIDKFIDKNIQISCFSGTENFDFFCWIYITLLTFWICTVFLSTIAKKLKISVESNISNILTIFDLNTNLNRFLSVKPSDFMALNGIRVFSMSWIILCHNFVVRALKDAYSVELDNFSHSFQVVLIRGGFFAVDSFFLLSGFLAAYKLTQYLENHKLTIHLYFNIMLQRYLRMVPLYFGSVLFFWKIMPKIGFFSNTPVDYVANAECEKLFFPYNILLINNFVNSQGCAVWTWYLASDFQFFLLAPLIVNFFISVHRSKKQSHFLIKILPIVVLLGAHFVITFLIISESKYLTTWAAKLQMTKSYYFKPFARISPYLVGMGFYFLLYNLKVKKLEEISSDQEISQTVPLLPKETDDSNKGYKIIKVSNKRAYLITIVSLVTMVFIVSIFYLQLRCTHGKEMCSLFFSHMMFGYVGENNLDAFSTEVLYTFCYFIWSIALAGFIFTIITNPANDKSGLRNFLSSRYLSLLSKLTFIAYLIHLPLVKLLIGPVHLPSFREVPFLTDTLGLFISTFLVSLPLYLTLELPLSGLFRHLLK